MKKQIVKTTSKLFLTLMLFLTAVTGFAQLPQQMNVDMRNVTLVDPSTIEFEIWIANASTNGDVCKLQSIQMGLDFNQAILDGGTPTSVLYLNNPALSAAGMKAHTPNMATPGHWRVAAQVELSSANATLIELAPTGIRYGTYRITNSVPFAQGQSTNFAWNVSNNTGKTRTTVTAFINASTLGKAYVKPGSTPFVSTAIEGLNPTVMNITIPSLCTDIHNAPVAVSACDSYVWAVDGNTYSVSGQYTAITPIPGGTCNQYDTLDLTINTTTNNPTQVETACDSYTWSVDGNTYTASGMYTYTGTGANGCPDNYTLDLTINTSTNNPTQIESACDSYTWSVDGNTYTASGIYTYTGTGANGCPDNYTLDLTTQLQIIPHKLKLLVIHTHGQ
ncbi:MAG: hypothetical protein R2831_02620 [Chitinophagaceae bacterium]